MSGAALPSAGATPARNSLARTASARPAVGRPGVASAVAGPALPPAPDPPEPGGAGIAGFQMVSESSALGRVTKRLACSAVSIFACPSGCASSDSMPAMVACSISGAVRSPGSLSIATPSTAAASTTVSATAIDMAAGWGGPPASTASTPPSPGHVGAWPAEAGGRAVADDRGGQVRAGGARAGAVARVILARQRPRERVQLVEDAGVGDCGRQLHEVELGIAVPPAHQVADRPGDTLEGVIQRQDVLHVVEVAGPRDVALAEHGERGARGRQRRRGRGRLARERPGS